MATVTKDFRIKSGLVVEGANATVDGSDIITEDIITGGTQTNIAVTYDAQNKVLNFVAENGVADSTTDDLAEGTSNLYFTDARAKDSAAALLTTANLTNITITGTGNGGLTITAENGVADSTTDDLDEGTTNLYYTDQRARNAISAAQGAPVTYNGNIGEIDFTLGANSGLNIDTANYGLELADVASNVGTFGSGTEIPTITVDDKGRVTAVTTNSVASDLSIAGDTGTDTVSLLNDTLTFNGDSNLTVAITDNTVTVSSNATSDPTMDTIVLRGNDGEGSSVIRSDVFVATNGVAIRGTQIGSGVGGLVIYDDTTNIYQNGTFKGSLNVNSGTITNLSTPVNPADAATKNYVDSIAAGLSWKPAVNLLATSNILLTGNTQTVAIDGHAALDGTDDGYRLLLIGQTTAEENGIYVYSDNGTTYTLTRAADLDTVGELDGAAVFVMEGTQYGSTSWVQANHYAAAFADQEWDQFSGAGTYLAGYGLTLTGNTFAVDATEIASQTDLGNAVDDLTAYVDGFLNSNDGTTIQYIDAQDLATLASANSYTDTAIETGDATATPTYLAIDYNSVAKQVAAQVSAPTADVPVVAYSFSKFDYRSAKFLVKVAYSTHTEVSEVLLTLDTSDNIAITEYAVVGTNGSLSLITADLEPVAMADVRLKVSPAHDNSTITVMGTLLV